MAAEAVDLTKNCRQCDICFQFGPWVPDGTPSEVEKQWKAWGESPTKSKTDQIGIFGTYLCKTCIKDEKARLAAEKLEDEEEEKNGKGYVASKKEQAAGHPFPVPRAASRGDVPSSSSASGASSTSQRPPASGTRQSTSKAKATLGSTADDPCLVDDSMGVCDSPQELTALDFYAPYQIGSTQERRVSGATPAARTPAPNRSNQAGKRRRG